VSSSRWPSSTGSKPGTTGAAGTPTARCSAPSTTKPDTPSPQPRHITTTDPSAGAGEAQTVVGAAGCGPIEPRRVGTREAEIRLDAPVLGRRYVPMVSSASFQRPWSDSRRSGDLVRPVQICFAIIV